LIVILASQNVTQDYVHIEEGLKLAVLRTSDGIERLLAQGVASLDTFQRLNFKIWALGRRIVQSVAGGVLLDLKVKMWDSQSAQALRGPEWKSR